MSFEDQLTLILNNCEKDQLNKYLNDDEAADILVKTFESYQELLSQKESLEKTNRDLAQNNLNLEPRREEAKARIKRNIQEFEKAKQEYLSLKEAHDIQSSSIGGGANMSLNSIRALLENRAIKEEEETDRQADEFFCTMNAMHNEEEVNNFQKQFLEARTSAHIKKIKAEKMKELVARY
jgi:hypothetical protein